MAGKKTFPRQSENILAHSESMSIVQAVENSGKNRDKKILRECTRDVLEGFDIGGGTPVI